MWRIVKTAAKRIIFKIQDLEELATSFQIRKSEREQDTWLQHSTEGGNYKVEATLKTLIGINIEDTFYLFRGHT